MESESTPAQALADVERATATLWTEYPPTPWWYYPAIGAWCGGLVLTLGGLHDSPLLLLLAMAALLALGRWFTAWYTRYRGTFPRLRSAPAEFRRAITSFVAGYVLLLMVTALVWVAAGFAAAAVVVFAGAAGGTFVYERAYAAAAATRERLG